MKNKQTAGSFGVIGLGRFGTALAITLSEAGKDVIAIDRDEDKVKAIRQYTDYAFVAETINMESLKETGIQNCDVVAVCIGEQIDASILITMSVLELGVPKVISKAMSPEQGAVLRKIGAEVVYPEKDMAIRLGKRLISNNFLDYISLDNDVEIQQLPVSSKMVGITVQEFNIRQRYGLNIIAIEREHTTDIEVSPQYRFAEDDIIVVIGRVENIKRFEMDLGD